VVIASAVPLRKSRREMSFGVYVSAYSELMRGLYLPCRPNRVRQIGCRDAFEVSYIISLFPP
jgi:hypothetical protein